MQYKNKFGTIQVMEEEITRQSIKKSNAEIIISPKLNKINYIDFHKFEKAIENGENAAIENIEKIKKII